MTEFPEEPRDELYPSGRALGPIAHGLIQGYLDPDHKVIDMERFFTALMQALHDAYALGWKDRGEVEERPK
jgi:hypothetical protein